MPFGSLLAGFIADHFSVTAAMIFMGIIAMAATVIFGLICPNTIIIKFKRFIF
jgi:hypothetical protein